MFSIEMHHFFHIIATNGSPKPQTLRLGVDRGNRGSHYLTEIYMCD